MAKRIGPALSACLLLLLSPMAGAAPSKPVERDAPPPRSVQVAPSQEYEFANCRFGVASTHTEFAFLDPVAKLNAGWFLDFSVCSLPDYVPEYTPLVRIRQERGGSTDCTVPWSYEIIPALTEGGLGHLVDSMPGARWMVGNEPERTGQDGVCPREYALAYHDVYEFIKGRDPTAQVFAGGIVLPSAMRMSFLDQIWSTYLAEYGEPLPADGWAVHLYVLSETGNGDANVALGTNPALGVPYTGSCADPLSLCHAEHDDIDLVEGLIVRVRQWMKDHGHQNRPLIVTEYGLIKPYNLGPGASCSSTTCAPGCFCDEFGETFHPQRVADFAEESFDLMLTLEDANLGYPADGNRLVQQWLWFRLKTWSPTSIGHAADLVDPDTVGSDGQWVFTAVGQRWHDYVRQIAPEPNLYVTEVPTATGSVDCGSGTAGVTLEAHIVNNGNYSPGGTATATFFADAALTVPIGVAVFDIPGGCVRDEVVMSTSWDGLSAGTHQFWVQLDGTGAPPGNVAVGTVVIAPALCYFTHLPIAFR